MVMRWNDAEQTVPNIETEIRYIIFEIKTSQQTFDCETDIGIKLNLILSECECFSTIRF
jgi:hypothetical protein